LYLIAVAAHYAITGDRDFFAQTRDSVIDSLEWFQRDADLDGDGLFEYETWAGDWGTKNQGWKDSIDAVLYEDGRRVENPLALLEIQAYARSAIWQMGLAFQQFGDEQRARELKDWAKRLRKRFIEAYWMPERQSFAIALDSQKRQVGGIASNLGHCLTAGIVNEEQAKAIVKQLFSPEMFSGWGLRTLSTAHAAYNPLSYHLGSVWPPENAVIALGLKRYGFDEELHKLNKGLLDLTRVFALNRLPEAVGGYPRDDAHPHPGIYPLANSPQAWSSATIIYILQMMLGAVPFAHHNTLYVYPSLPDWLPELTMRNMPCGKGRVSVQFWRDGDGQQQYEVLEATHGVKVERKPLRDLERQGIWGNI
jgi:glycogen debranching enzyme